MLRFRTIDDAFRCLLSRVLVEGIPVESRNGMTLELANQALIIEQPTKRYLHTPGRNNNPFAAIAETMWVLAGRNDLAYLTPYLKRAPNYSDDDGVTWRAGYGPRLRNWNGVDQVSQVRMLLDASPISRRAVISLFNPELDFEDSKDIPCNNWMHFTVREGRLELTVVARSTDVWFGFSAINAFEWSVLLEMMARWLQLEIGCLTFFTSSLHLYTEYEERARDMLRTESAGLEYIGRGVFPYDTGWAEAASSHKQWMDVEQRLRDGEDLENIVVPFQDPLLVSFIRAIDIYWAFKRGASVDSLEPRLCLLGETDLGVAAREFVRRERAREH